jgi:hypothetical protein
VEIMEEKFNMKYLKFPMRIREIKRIFFSLLDEKAKGMIAQKVSKQNGDVRVAFDILKSSFIHL